MRRKRSEKPRYVYELRDLPPDQPAVIRLEGGGTLIHCSRRQLNALNLRNETMAWLIAQSWGEYDSKALAFVFRDGEWLRKALAMPVDDPPCEPPLSLDQRLGRRGQTDPGLIISFRSPSKGLLSFPCRRFAKYEDNLRAVALSLEALRKVDRYGVTQRAEQYQGWKQIEEPKPAFAGQQDAARFLSVKAYRDERFWSRILTDPDARQQAYHAAARLVHPDASSGSHEEFVRLQQALRMFER